MIMALLAGVALSYPLYLDSFTNKPIRIVAMEDKNLLASEFVKDFGTNPFRVIDILNPANGYNTRSQINRNGPVFKVRVGGSWLCRNRRDLSKCADNTDFWEITRSGDGFTISQEGYCLSTEGKGRLILERCNGRSRSHLFLFEDMEIEDCMDSVDLGGQPRTEAEKVKQLKLKKKLDDLKKKDRAKAEKIKKKLEEKNDFEKYAKKNLPDLTGKDDSKEVLSKLWDFGWKRPKFSFPSFPWFKFPFCKKLW
ncbi:hypothetical protein EROM_071040 [Encephalitozoon romaleae SJ-2008]|uniref:Ricin B lectin domain-containing protein n=1 Tax=Encephalitozoon romaleae (strain SJ-2008) TaxID=1178016 RepID=I7AF87_ENCRO|nr:hypothetical protein EROM_071040 [Encephalitozoon romaleae SJ-2008]AFN83355.1 hypothetical protein EROM_071040 [Encephalitozoon romaleae SJ-2008]